MPPERTSLLFSRVRRLSPLSLPLFGRFPPLQAAYTFPIALRSSYRQASTSFHAFADRLRLRQQNSWPTELNDDLVPDNLTGYNQEEDFVESLIITEPEVHEDTSGATTGEPQHEAANLETESIISISDTNCSIISISDDSSVGSVDNPFGGVPELRPGPDERNHVDLSREAGGIWQVAPRYGSIRYKKCLRVAGRPPPNNTWSFSYDGLFDAPNPAGSRVGNVHYSPDEEGGEEGEMVYEWVAAQLGDPHPTDPRVTLDRRYGGAPCWIG
ncbi:hypothetical protein FRC09_020659 [Ceratobasidium sp. 395]|nr:hypothetical protein FRC09_020659 [Ceratobasidium sp. 395]